MYLNISVKHRAQTTRLTGTYTCYLPWVVRLCARARERVWADRPYTGGVNVSYACFPGTCLFFVIVVQALVTVYTWCQRIFSMIKRLGPSLRVFPLIFVSQTRFSNEFRKSRKETEEKKKSTLITIKPHDDVTGKCITVLENN